MSKTVSNDFINIIKNGGPFFSYATVTFSDGSQKTYTSEEDFTIGENGYSENSENGFPLGEALSKSIKINLDNSEGQNDGKDFYYARMALYTEADLPDGTQERIQEGIFTVIDAVTPGDILEITAYDDMYKADKEFVSTLSYPVSAQQLLAEVCQKCDITLGSATFFNNDFQIMQAPEGLTGRQVIGYIAQIACGNAVIDNDSRLIIKTYDFSGFETTETVSAGDVVTASGIHVISEYTAEPDIDVNDVTITGISVDLNDDEDSTYVSGTEDYAIKIENPLIEGQEKNVVDTLAAVLVGTTIRPFSGDFMPDPTIEFMDLTYIVNTKDNVFKTFITSHDFTYGGVSTLSCGVEGPERNSGTYYSEASAVYQKAKKDIEKNKTQWEEAIENLSQQVANASGLYTTEEKQPDGSTIFYMHNKPELSESDIVWKMTAETLTVSTDGGQSWNAGITVNGTVIAQIMSTIGINFDWGVGGTLIIQDDDGNQTAYIDADTGVVRLSVESLRISGKTVEQIAQEESNSAVNDFVDAVYNPAIQNLQQQIDGQIMTYYEDYEPTLENEPAVEWTTEELKQQHEGDLFYWKSKGYSYRFFKDGDTWKWQMVQDTDITLALQQASAAQDTADQKRRVFVTQPTPPYDVGDLWVGNTSSDLMRCQTARQSGNYSASDWVKATKYTDDTVANQALAEAQNARNLNIILDNEYQGIPTDSEGNYTTFPECKTTVQVLYGHADISANCSYSISKSTSVAGNWDLTTRTYTITGLTADEGYVDITATYLSMYTVSKRFSVAKIRAGADGLPGQDGADGQQGEDGVGVSSISSKYAVSSSNTTAPTTWHDVPQTMTETNKYLWTYDIIAYTNGTQEETDKRVIGVYGNTGSPGATGEAGTSVESITTEFYLSTSKETPTGGSWTTTMPTWSNGMYLWIRSKIVYINPSSTEYTVPYCDSSWEAVNEIEIGGRNLFLNSGNLNQSMMGQISGFTFLSVEDTFVPSKQSLQCELTTLGSFDVNGIFFSGNNYIDRLNVGDTCTVSFWIKCSREQSCTITTEFMNSKQKITTLTTSWKKIVLTDLVSRASGPIEIAISIYSSGFIVGDLIYLSSPKVEKGNTPTDWTPAPEDTKSIESYTTTYQAGSSGTTPPTGTWSNSPVSTSDTNPYLWVRNVVSYSNGTNDEFYSVAAQGSKGLKGDPGEQGIQGKPGENGQTSYLHIAYANNATGTSGFSTTDSTNKLYIGQYTDFSATDSTDPSKYSWTKIKGDTGDTGPKGDKGDTGAAGAAGRTYFIELSSNVAVRGENGAVRPASITANAYYRNGTSATRTAYAGRWRVQTSTNGTSWTTVTTSSANEAAKTYTVSNLAESINYIRFVLYAAGGTTTQLDMQTIPIVVDISSLSHEDVFNLLTNNGQMEGIFEEGGQLYINGSYIQVDDLSALGATIGNWRIEADSIYYPDDTTVGTTVLTGGEMEFWKSYQGFLDDDPEGVYGYIRGLANGNAITIGGFNVEIAASRSITIDGDTTVTGSLILDISSMSITCSDYINIDSNVDMFGQLDIDGKLIISGDDNIETYGSNFVFHGGTGKSTILRKDGAAFYILLSDNGGGASWNGKRPFTIDLSTGNVAMNANVSVSSLTISGNSVTDYVVASGSSGIWRYIKWNSGLAMCWTDSYKSTDNFPSTQWGSVWSSVDFTFGTYPFAFANAPVCFCNKIGGDTNVYAQAFGWMAQGYGNQTTGTCLWDFIRPDSTVLGHPQFRMVAIGRWK